MELPTILTANWRTVEGSATDQPWALESSTGLFVLADITVKKDGKKWMHVSFSRRSGIPSYRDILMVKNTFMRTLKAIQIFPPEDEHVNIHPNCLHLWACEEDLIPDMRSELGI